MAQTEEGEWWKPDISSHVRIDNPSNEDILEFVENDKINGLRLYTPRSSAYIAPSASGSLSSSAVPPLPDSFDPFRFLITSAIQQNQWIPLFLERASFQEQLARDAYQATFLDFRARLNKTLTNLVLGREPTHPTSLAEEVTILSRDFVPQTIDLSPSLMDWLLRRFAAQFKHMESSKSPEQISQARSEWRIRTQQYNGHIRKSDDDSSCVPCQLALTGSGPAPVSIQTSPSRLLQLPTEILELILEYVVGRERRTIWAIHKYGPICKDRHTARNCTIHKDALFYPAHDSWLLGEGLTSSPWFRNHVFSTQATLRSIAEYNHDRIVLPEGNIKYTDDKGQETVVLWPAKESLEASLARFHELHSLDTDVMATCKQLASATERVLLRIKIIGIAHHQCPRYNQSQFGDDVISCGRCIWLLQTAKNLHIRCTKSGELATMASILVQRTDILSIKFRMPKLWLSALRGLKCGNRIDFERLYPHRLPGPQMSYEVFALDLIIKDWSAEDDQKIVVFKEIVKHHTAGDPPYWDDTELGSLWNEDGYASMGTMPKLFMSEREARWERQEWYEQEWGSNQLDNTFDW